jgi:hypothetical protein
MPTPRPCQPTAAASRTAASIMRIVIGTMPSPQSINAAGYNRARGRKTVVRWKLCESAVLERRVIVRRWRVRREIADIEHCPEQFRFRRDCLRLRDYVGSRVLGSSSMSEFGRVVPRVYSAVATLSSIGPSSVCNTHNNGYRCQQWAIGYKSRRTALCNADN